MNNYITIQPIDEKIDFVNLAITLSNVNSKSSRRYGSSL